MSTAWRGAGGPVLLPSREGVTTVSLKVGMIIEAFVSIFRDNFADDST